MTEMVDEFYEGDIYEGAPDDLPRHLDGTQDLTEMAPRAFISPTQRTTKEMIDFYKEHLSSWPFDPDGMCLAVCRTARNIGPRYASALEAQQDTPTVHRVSKIADIRKGMVAFFDTVGDSNPYGHIVTIAGRARGVDPRSLRSLICYTNSVVANQIVAVRGDYFGEHWGDEFQFAATWLNGEELKLNEPVAPKPAPVLTADIRVMHISMQAGDTERAKASDVDKIFRRAATKGTRWITGTEGNGSDQLLAHLLEDSAQVHGYRFVKAAGDCWIAVKKDKIAGGIDQNYDKVVDAHRPLGVLSASFDDLQYGHITVIAMHLLKDGRPGTDGAFLDENRQAMHKVAEVAKQAGAGRHLVFYGGDQNINDRRDDTFLGKPFTSAQDELGKYEDTGHGPIDVIASYDSDKRVSAVWVRVLGDAELQLSTDHYLVEAGFKIQL